MTRTVSIIQTSNGWFWVRVGDVWVCIEPGHLDEVRTGEALEDEFSAPIQFRTIDLPDLVSQVPGQLEIPYS